MLVRRAACRAAWSTMDSRALPSSAAVAAACSEAAARRVPSSALSCCSRSCILSPWPRLSSRSRITPTLSWSKACWLSRVALSTASRWESVHLVAVSSPETCSFSSLARLSETWDSCSASRVLSSSFSTVSARCTAACSVVCLRARALCASSTCASMYCNRHSISTKESAPTPQLSLVASMLGPPAPRSRGVVIIRCEATGLFSMPWALCA
mmetsp:Transcript_6609/g.21670  ORF Transcript_6609/g.21670 Transcript_6609/m.21670 type:complete len:211 (+) Transcript_6609:2803-3435(+)